MASKARNKRSLTSDETNPADNGISTDIANGENRGNLIGPAAKKARGGKGMSQPG